MQVFRYFINTVIIILPTVSAVLMASSAAAFVMTKYRIRGRLPLLLFFTAGSMFPAQVIYYPIFKAYIMIGDVFGDRTILYDNYIGVILVHTAMQTGFATFVLHSHLKRLPKELSEQAEVDGASVWRHFWSIIVPLLRAPLATLAILISTFLYNDFVVAWSLLKSDSLYPITTSLTRVGAFNRVIPDQGVLAAGAFMVALPLLILFITMRKSFASGVMLGTSK
jgi:multiple sugar transport system permease protein